MPKNVFERNMDWALAQKMLTIWRESRADATGTPKQREIWRMMKVLEYVREFDPLRGKEK